MSKNAVLTKIMADSNKKWGEGSLIRGSDVVNWRQGRASTGSLSFDAMLGGGWPLNVWNEVIGYESNGKTVLALKTLAANQAADPDYEAVWIASEPFDVPWAIQLGVDMDRITIAPTSIMEAAYQIIVDTMDARAADAIILDSLPALSPSEEVEKAMDELTVGTPAKMTNQFVRKSGKAGRRSLVSEDRDCLFLIVNQWRQTIGVTRGDPRTTPGGLGKNYAFATRVEVAREDWINRGQDNRVGLTIKARTTKNKTFPPQRRASVDFYFEDAPPFRKGDFDTFKEQVNLGLTYDVIERAGAYYRFDGQQWQGKDAMFEGLREDVELSAKVSAAVMEEVQRRANA